MHGRTTFSTLASGLSVAALLGTTAACSPKQDTSTMADTAAMSATTMPTAGMSATDTGMGAGNMMVMTAEDSSKADQQFLRKMSDHHTGMIAMTDVALGRSDGITVKDDAQKLKTAQVAEVDTMLKMLKTKFSDSYTPTVSAMNQAMVDSLKGTADPQAFSRMFLQNIINHHQMAIAMINNFMPLLETPQLRTMAARMKRDQTAEIAKFTAEVKAM